MILIQVNKNSSRIIHRHGAAPAYDQEYIKKNLNNNLNYRHVIIPSKPGGETLLAFSKKKCKKFFPFNMSWNRSSFR